MECEIRSLFHYIWIIKAYDYKSYLKNEWAYIASKFFRVRKFLRFFEQNFHFKLLGHRDFSTKNLVLLKFRSNSDLPTFRKMMRKWKKNIPKKCRQFFFINTSISSFGKEYRRFSLNKYNPGLGLRYIAVIVNAIWWWKKAYAADPRRLNRFSQFSFLRKKFLSVHSLA